MSIVRETGVIASSGFNGNMLIYNKNKEAEKYLLNNGKVVCVKWHPNPNIPLLLSSSDDKSAKLWGPK